MGNLLDKKGLNAISSNSTYLISVKSLNKDASLLFDFEKTRANMLISIKNNFWLRQELIDPSRQIDSNKDKNSYFELKANSSVKAKLKCKAKYTNNESTRYFFKTVIHFYVRRNNFFPPKKKGNLKLCSRFSWFLLHLPGRETAR